MKYCLRLLTVLLCLCLLFTGCGETEQHEQEPSATTTTTTTTTTGTTTTTATEAQDFLISEDEALELVQQHLGIYNGDRDPETGFLMSWMLEESPTAEKPLYTFVLRWLVEQNGEASHWSTINWLSVDAYTGTIIA